MVRLQAWRLNRPSDDRLGFIIQMLGRAVVAGREVTELSDIMIIWLASYPRSGNTFFRMLLYYACGFKTYSTYSDHLFDRLEASETVGHEPLPAPLETLASSPDIYFVKTHDLPVDRNPAIYLVRDGRDAIVSFARYVRSFERKPGMVKLLKEVLGIDSFRTSLERLITSKERYGGWNGHVLAWLNRAHDGPQVVVRFEDLVQDPDRWLGQAMNQFGLKRTAASGEAIPDFATLHQRWPQFFRKGKIGSWREEIPDELHELFWQHHAEAMNTLGYPR